MAEREQYKIENNLVLFDGVCNLCNATIQRLIRWDKKKVLKFSSLQSEIGQTILREHALNLQEFNTFLYLRNGRLFTRSDAALEVLNDLGGIGKLAQIFYVIPRFVRNGVYDFVSRNRYKWFGKQENCMIPTREMKERFLN
ncbi:MAG: DCC1-like thiol-disulfide oxidoreductase family protein [Flavobacteriaceae bacterium]|nr:DCC1-like thiol-disulfide oxidoreductase family protein [Flavobacteriaceae bacterium]